MIHFPVLARWTEIFNPFLPLCSHLVKDCIWSEVVHNCTGSASSSCSSPLVMSPVCALSKNGKILAKVVESAFSGNKKTIMRRTAESDEESAGKKYPSSPVRKVFKGIFLKLQVRHSKPVVFAQKHFMIQLQIFMCIDPNAFTDSSSCTSCHTRRDSFTTSWKTNNRCTL